MSKPSDKKRKKQQTKQKRKDAARQQSAQRRQYIDTYPQFSFADKNDAPEEFVDLIRNAAKKVDFRDRSVFSPAEVAVWKDLKKRGPVVIRELVTAAKDNPVFATVFACNLGQVVFSLIPEVELRKWIPFCDVQFLPQGDDIKVTFQSLQRKKGAGGTIYYSRHSPTLSIDGQQKVVGFARHAIEQTCERISYRWFTYAGLGDAFSFFDHCVHFERCDLDGGQLAFTFYGQCAKGFFSSGYVKCLLGHELDDNDRYYYRVGYCPAVVEGDFVKATTLLFPGYTKTPEFQVVQKMKASYEEKRALIEKAKLQTARVLHETRDFSLLKLFHDAGIPQVVESDEEWYASPLE